MIVLPNCPRCGGVPHIAQVRAGYVGKCARCGTETEAAGDCKDAAMKWCDWAANVEADVMAGRYGLKNG